MTAISLLLVAIGGFSGAIGRYGVSQWVKRYSSASFPLGTFLVNISGSFLLGWLLAAGVSKTYLLLVGTGFLGSFTTFSTLQLELINYGLQGRWNKGAVYAAATFLMGLIAAAAGYFIGQSS
jgi:fluoride exporter